MTKNPNLKTVCDNCSATYIVKHDLPEDYIEQFCPFCGEEHEEVEETITDIDENWDSIGSGDSPDGISREVLKEWGEAYLFWITYQRKIQAIGEECLANLETFTSCRSQKLGQTMELERQSTEPLNVVQAKIQAWQEKYVNQ